jgi:transcriptional regulator with XRE-family HTH domain
MRTSGLTQMETAERIGCSQSGVSKMLRGTTMAPTTQAAALTWIKSVENESAGIAEEVKVEDTSLALTDFEHRQQPPAPTNGRPLFSVLEQPSQERSAEERSEKEPTVQSSAPSPNDGSELPPNPPLPSETASEDNELFVHDCDQVSAIEADEVSAAEGHEVIAAEADGFSTAGGNAVSGAGDGVFPAQGAGDQPCWVPDVEPVGSRTLSRVPNPYEAVLRSLLEPAAQRHLEQIAGPAAVGIVVRVSLEWHGLPETGPL